MFVPVVVAPAATVYLSLWLLDAELDYSLPLLPVARLEFCNLGVIVYDECGLDAALDACLCPF